jgi:hypothetical protein
MPTALPALLRRLAGPKQRRRSLYETSRGESLETRVLPAAVAVVSRGSLNITGDAEAASNLRITQSGAGVRVEALAGSQISVGGVLQTDVTFPSVTSMNVRLSEGDDSVALSGAISLKNVNLDLGDGDNVLDVGAGLNVTGKLTINGGTGFDQVTLNGAVSKGATINLGLGNDELTIHGGVFSTAVSINTGVGADDVTIDTNASFNNNLSITTGEDNDTVTINNTTTKKVTINTGDDDDTVDLRTNVQINGLLSVNTSAGADDLNLVDVHVNANGTSSLNVGTGPDDVVIETSVFAGTLNIDLGTGIVNTLKIDDTDFQNNFSLTANGSVNGLGVGDVINIETDTSLLGTTTFRKTAKLKVGAAADINLGVVHAASDLDFLGAVSISGINPAADLTVATNHVLFASLNLNKVVRTDIV